MESYLGTLTDAGFSDQAAVAAYRAYSSFLLGHLLLKVRQIGARVSLLDQPKGDFSAQARTDMTRSPNLLRSEPLLSLDKSAAEIEEAPKNLLDRLERVLNEAKSNGGEVADLAQGVRPLALMNLARQDLFRSSRGARSHQAHRNPARAVYNVNRRARLSLTATVQPCGCPPPPGGKQRDQHCRHHSHHR